MQIHNFYSDLLLSIRSLFDNKIFANNFIRHYSFNIANRTFELSKRDYKPNRALPAVIVNLEDDQYSFGERPTTVRHSSIENTNQIPVLYDQIANKLIYVQEEQTTITLSININCESQFQAKEVEFTIKRNLPQNKFTQIHSFTSFLEIHSDILLSCGMDFNDHPITNLFTKLNNNLGDSEFCFSMNYNPLIRVESITSNISSSTQLTYQVTMNLSVMIQMPIYFLLDEIKNDILKINMDFSRFGNEPISSNSMRSFNQQSEKLYLVDASKQVRRNVLIHDITEPQYNSTTLIVNDIDYTLFEIHINSTDLVIKENFIFRFFDIYNNIHIIIPTLIDTDINTVKFQLTTTDYEQYFCASLTLPIIVQFVEVLSED